MAKKPPPKPAKSVGRPKNPVDWDVFDELCRIQCTSLEIQAVLKISPDALLKRCKAEKGMNLKDYIKQQSLHGNASLRRMQHKSAEKGSVPMQMWLGKQQLGQGDKVTIELPTPTIIQKRDGSQVIMGVKESETIEGEVISDEKDD